MGKSTQPKLQPREPIEAFLYELLEVIWRVAKHLVKATGHVLRHDWPYVLLYAALVALADLVFGVDYISRHPRVPLLLAAIVAFLMVAIVRKATHRPVQEPAGDHLQRQVEGVVGSAMPTSGEEPKPVIKLNTSRRTLTSVEVSHLPYNVDPEKQGLVERLWQHRVPPPASANDWVFEWDLHHNRVTVTPKTISPLPEQVELPVDAAPKGLAFRLGQVLDCDGHNPKWVWWDPDESDPHLLSTGPTKSGKSVLLRVLIAQALAGDWEIIIADPKGVDYRWSDEMPRVRRAGGDSAYAAIDWAYTEMGRRQRWMGDHAPPTATNLGEVSDNPFRPCLVIVDETAEMLGLGGPDAADAKEEKARRGQTLKELGSLARRSRFVQIVMCVATQRADATIVPVEVRGNLGTRVLTGEGENGHKQMAFGTAQVPRLPAGYPRGRGRVMIGGGMPREMQVPWISTQAILEAHPPVSDRSRVRRILAEIGSPPLAPRPPVFEAQTGSVPPPPPLDDDLSATPPSPPSRPTIGDDDGLISPPLDLDD